MAISIWSWEIGVAHFNYAITIGSMVLNFVKNKPFMSNLKQTIILISAQTLGAFFGMFLSYLATYKLQSDIQAPKSTALCPFYTQQPDDEGVVNQCNKTGLSLQVYANNFIVSFLFVVVYLVIKNTKMTGSLTKVQNLLKPFFVFFAFN